MGDCHRSLQMVYFRGRIFRPNRNGGLEIDLVPGSLVGLKTTGIHIIEDSIITDVGYKEVKSGVAVRLFVIPRQEYVETNSKNIVPVPDEAGVMPAVFTPQFIAQYLNMEDPPTWLSSQLEIPPLASRKVEANPRVFRIRSKFLRKNTSKRSDKKN